MITSQQINEKLKDEKDPLGYIDGEIARLAGQLGDRCKDVQDAISRYNDRKERDEQIEMQKIREDLMKTGELYMDLNQFVKARKEQVRQQKRAERLNKALAQRQKK